MKMTLITPIYLKYNFNVLIRSISKIEKYILKDDANQTCLYNLIPEFITQPKQSPNNSEFNI